MKRFSQVAVVAVLWLMCSPFPAQAAEGRVQLWDHGANTHIAGPGAPKHIIGLPRLMHDISLNTGTSAYALRYVISHDPKEPTVAIPGEGYIGMPRPVDANWYGGGFFDLKLNGESVGTTMVETFCGRSTGARGQIDYVFDDPRAIIRVRFVGLAGDDCLYAQVLLEPRVELTKVGVNLRCYPSAFVSRSHGSERHVLTPTRDLEPGERATLDPATESWLNYYDAVYDHGVTTASGTGRGPCSVLWLPAQTQQASVSVGDYGIDTSLQLDPSLHDFRFVFFDHAGTANATAQQRLREAAPQIHERLAQFIFTDESVANWPLAEKIEETRRLLGELPDDAARAARYDEWARELRQHLQLIRATQADGAIMAEGMAVKTITQWEQSLPELRLQALLNSF